MSGRGRGRDATTPEWMNGAASNRYVPSQAAKVRSLEIDGYNTVDGQSANQYVNLVRSCLATDAGYLAEWQMKRTRIASPLKQLER